MHSCRAHILQFSAPFTASVKIYFYFCFLCYFMRFAPTFPCRFRCVAKNCGNKLLVPRWMWGTNMYVKERATARHRCGEAEKCRFILHDFIFVCMHVYVLTGTRTYIYKYIVHTLSKGNSTSIHSIYFSLLFLLTVPPHTQTSCWNNSPHFINLQTHTHKAEAEVKANKYKYPLYK